MKELLAIFSIILISQGAYAMDEKNIKTAVFAGGCFWCVESDFEKLNGVIKAESGYAGGKEENPTYKQVSAGRTTHAEVAKIYYDKTKISYAELLDKFWHSIDPTVKNRQFCDVGQQYRTAIFYQTEEEKALAEKTKKQAEEYLGLKVYTEIEKLDNFYLAEDYHQDYYKKNPIRYKYYRYSCGRDKRVKEVWHLLKKVTLD
ncbi:MAG TPA: peptide-methionine (S)-S-oxide reductase [Alphaproteobacteria bacterium]|nr:peptide-methionine (S)-S-oxide reductase [Alphaproteobacteria bacterium]